MTVKNADATSTGSDEAATAEPTFDRRGFMILGAGGLLAAVLQSARPAAAQSAQRRGTLVIALDISDATGLDPVRVYQYSNPLPTHAAYDGMVTFDPGDSVNLKPALATEWAYQPDGKTVRLKLRTDVKFASGKPMTAEDVRFSFTRQLNIKDQPWQYISHIEEVKVVDSHTVDIVLKDPSLPLMTIIATPAFGVLEKELVIAHGGTDAPDAKEKDKATDWLNENSAGTGPYRLTGWQRNQQIQMVKNPNYWKGTPGYDRVLIRHMSESAAQLLAIQRGDVDVAFNLIPEQIATLKDDPNITVAGMTSLDFIYMAVVEAPTNPALQNKLARQAIGYAIDYDGIIKNLIGGKAVRPVSFLPVGVNGSTEELTKEIGFREDLAKSKQLLAQAGMPDGFKFQLSYGNAAIAGVGYQNLAQKLQSDLARVGIRGRADADGPGQHADHVSGREARGGADLLEPAGAGKLAVEQRHDQPRGRPRALEGARRSPQAGGRRGCGTRSGEGRSALQAIPAGDGRCGPPLRADPAGVSGGGAQERVRPEIDGGRLDGRAGRSQARLMLLPVIPSGAKRSRGTSSCRRGVKKRSLRYASLRSAPVGMTEFGSGGAAA